MMDVVNPIKYNVIIVRYGEVTLKSMPVRERMENILVDNIKFMLERNGISILDIKRIPGRIFIYLKESDDYIKALDILSRVFGIISFSPAIEISNELNILRDSVVDYASKILDEGCRFAVRARRVKIYPVNSKELERILGADILTRLSDRGLKVNLNNPDKTIYVEVRSSKAYIYHEIIKGAGGLPYGVESKVLSLISGGIDSPVATWLVMRRGAEAILLYYNLGKYTSIDAIERVYKVVEALKKWIPRDELILHEVDYQPVLDYITSHAPIKYTCIICRMFMLKIAEELANSINAKALITGESIGQVASQTLDNIHIINQVVKIPVLRPLIGFDKIEIEDLARRIGTYDISAREVVECKASPRYHGKPVSAHADIDRVMNIWSRLDREYLIGNVLNSIREIRI